jgi:beta-galactosidase
MNLKFILNSDFGRVWRAFLLLLVLCAFCPAIRAAQTVQPRKNIPLNEGWFFSPQDLPDAAQNSVDLSRWEKVNLPHTWNAFDAFDDPPGYRMGIGWYRKEIILPENLQGKRIFLCFEAVGQKAEVFINGKLAGAHQGGYTAFKIEITDDLQKDWTKPQIIAVKADNSADPDLAPPPSADFNAYGGIYRDVSLTAVVPLHFSLDDYASAGVYLDTPEASNEKAVVRVRGGVTNHLNTANGLKVVSTVFDAKGKTVARLESAISATGQKSGTFEQKGVIIKPNLWSPETPYLYRLKTELYSSGQLVDEVSLSVGIRWFSFDPNNGFSLNGKPYKLRGTNRHQDYPGIGNALSNELHENDLRIIKDTGFNMVLLPHYPQDPAVLDAADRSGLFIWAELPLVRQISTSEKYAQNSREMFRELIRQQYNHPSIIIWCYMNEIFLRPLNEPGYVIKTVQLARELEAIARAEDPLRYTAISANRPYDGSDVYNASGLMQIPKIAAWHMYFGWYYGDFKDFGLFLDAQHRRYPRQNIFVSEFGADYDVRLHSLDPGIGDGTAEWARSFHESYLEQLESKTYLAGSGVWAQFEFGSETRGDSRPQINTKGIFTFERRPKDVAFLYRAYLSKEPVLYIAARDWPNRRAPVNAPDIKTTVYPITVYSNLPQVELFVNRRSLGVKEVITKKAVWDAALSDGLNELETRGKFNGKDISDRTEIRLVRRPEPLTADFLQKDGLSINAGSNIQFIDAEGNVWEADQSYQPNGWGFIDGKSGKVSQNIVNTPDDPLYQSFRQGFSGYRFDVPAGEYEIELHFAEPSVEKRGERVFNISANGVNLLKNFDLFNEAGLSKRLIKKFKIRVKGKNGLAVEFQAVKGETVLSALRLRRLSLK